MSTPVHPEPGDASAPQTPADSTPVPKERTPPPPAAPAPAPPFAPVYREPWVNPARRRQVAGIGAFALVIALGAGIGVGYAVGGDGHPDRPRNGLVMLPGPVEGAPGGFGPHGQPGEVPGVRPGGQPRGNS